MPKPGTFLTYRELFDHLPTKEELANTIKGLNAFNTVILTARLRRSSQQETLRASEYPPTACRKLRQR